MDIFSAFEEGKDGTIIQYSEDFGTTWTMIGTIGEGINWYNTSAIMANPGDQTVRQEGWSTESNEWVTAKHDLDILKGKENVQFRIAFASAPGLSNKGFAFDNIWIGNRTKKVLLEHFTNSSDNSSASANTIINSIANGLPLDVIDIQYHTNFPGADPFNELNPYVSSARSLHYGLSSIPITIMNGTEHFDFSQNQISKNKVIIASLDDVNFNMDISANINSSTIATEVAITSQIDTSDLELTLFVAVLEKEITGISGTNGEIKFESVIKEMLPNPAGETIQKSWSINETLNKNYNWDVKNITDIDEIILVAFIQDKNTLEIYQAATTDTTTLPTSIQEFVNNTDKFSLLVFPNPVSEKVSILSNQPITKNSKLRILNQEGQVVINKEIKATTNLLEINVNNLLSGFYYIQIITKDGNNATKKLIIR